MSNQNPKGVIILFGCKNIVSHLPGVYVSHTTSCRLSPKSSPKFSTKHNTLGQHSRRNDNQHDQLIIYLTSNKQTSNTHSQTRYSDSLFFSGHHAGLLLQIYGVDKSVHWSAQWASFNKVVNFPESSKRIWNQRRSEDRPLEVFVVNVGTTSGWTDDNKWSHILCYRKVSNMDGWCCVLEGVVELWNILAIKLLDGVLDFCAFVDGSGGLMKC